MEDSDLKRNSIKKNARGAHPLFPICGEYIINGTIEVSLSNYGLHGSGTCNIYKSQIWDL